MMHKLAALMENGVELPDLGSRPTLCLSIFGTTQVIHSTPGVVSQYLVGSHVNEPNAA